MSSKKDQYLAGLKAIQETENTESAVVNEPEKVEKTVEKPVETIKEEASKETIVESPKEPELFPGESLLPEEARKNLRERWAAQAEAQTKLDADIKQRNHEYNQLHNRLAPTQQQLSKSQLENAKLQKQVNELLAVKQSSLSAETKQKLKEYREQFPFEADLMESLVNPALSEAENAKRYASSLEEKMRQIEQRLYVDEQKQMLSSVHPDWQQKLHSDEYKVWKENLDVYERQRFEPLMSSPHAQDAVFVLNNFERDRLLAMQLKRNQHATPKTLAASPATAAPALDPDPSRRTTAPVTKSAGQPMSDKKRAFVEAAEFLKKQKRRA